MHSLHVHFLLLVALLSLFSEKRCFAERLLQGIVVDFDYSVRLLSYTLLQEPATNLQNSGNTIFQIPENRAVFELRPDFILGYKNIDISAKPRLRYQWERREVGGISDEDESGELFVNEWLVRFMASDRLFFSYGRENLQWGPGWLSSPSNPFFYSNGRLNPELEVPGKDLPSSRS